MAKRTALSGRFHEEMHAPSSPVEVHGDWQAYDRLVQLEHAMQRGAQLESELGPRQIGNIAAQWAARWQKIAAGVVGQMYDALRFIDKDTWWCHLLDGVAVQS